MRPKIMIVEDEQLIRNLLVDFLKQDYEIIQASNGLEALDLFDQSINLIVLDVMMPFMDGYETCKQIKAKSDIPIIMLTAKNMEHDEIYGFQLGVDDYVTKPFSPLVLKKRIENILKRNNVTVNQFVYQDLVLDYDRSQLYIDNQAITLSPTEYNLLEYLIQHTNKVISRESLLDQVWGYDYYGDARVVDTNITRLRHKLKHHQHLIKTVRGKGYLFEKN